MQKAAEFRPLFEAAERQRSPHAYALALRDFMWSIPDTHVGFDQSLISGDFQNDVAGGLGLGIRETDDGKIIANYILKDGPADAGRHAMGRGGPDLRRDADRRGGVRQRAVVVALQQSRDQAPAAAALRHALSDGQGHGARSSSRIRAERRENGSASRWSTRLTASTRPPSRPGDEATLPVEYRMLPSGLGYVRISSFLDNDVLSIQVWERAMRDFNENAVPGVILDMRQNSGGSGWLANQMAAYFFDEETVVGKTMHYDKATGEFYLDPDDESIMIPPPEDLRYDGRVAVLVGPACASACEFFSYDMTINDRAVIVGPVSVRGRRRQRGGVLHAGGHLLPVDHRPGDGRRRRRSTWRAAAWCRPSRFR